MSEEQQGEKQTEYLVLTGNQVVAHNLRMARLLRGWTQEEATERLEPHLGVRWSKASYSAAERSAERDDRIRNFTADELLAFSLAFELPVTWFLLPVPPDLAGRIPLVGTTQKEEGGHRQGTLIELVFGTPSGQAEVEKRLDQVLGSLPFEEYGGYMALVGRTAGLAALATVKRVVGELGGWTRSLRDLAAMLDEAENLTVEMMDKGLEEFSRSCAEDVAEPEPQSDAGPR